MCKGKMNIKMNISALTKNMNISYTGGGWGARERNWTPEWEKDISVLTEFIDSGTRQLHLQFVGKMIKKGGISRHISWACCSLLHATSGRRHRHRPAVTTPIGSRTKSPPALPSRTVAGKTLSQSVGCAFSVTRTSILSVCGPRRTLLLFSRPAGALRFSARVPGVSVFFCVAYALRATVETARCRSSGPKYILHPGLLTVCMYSERVQAVFWIICSMRWRLIDILSVAGKNYRFCV